MACLLFSNFSRSLHYASALALLLCATGCGGDDEGDSGGEGASDSGGAGTGGAGTGGAGSGAASSSGGLSSTGGSDASGGTGGGAPSSGGRDASGGAGGTEGSFNCDIRDITCKRVAPEACPEGQVHAVEGGCYGSCVSISSCTCAEQDDCPDPKNIDEFACIMSTGRCEYLLR